jgi:uncharacterized protein (TIGR02145 family)
MKKLTWKYLFLTGLIMIFHPGCKEEDDLIEIEDEAYHSVIIGSQTWMVENLRVTHYRNGDPIPNVILASEWDTLTTGAYCEYNDDDNAVKPYGRLYNWYAVHDARNLAPEGWHIPTEDEFRLLIASAGAEDAAGGRLKESGTNHWKYPNTNATDIYGFTALPGGIFSASGFAGLGEIGNIWSSTAFSEDHAYYLCLGHSTGRAFVAYQDKGLGFTVRCVKDY